MKKKIPLCTKVFCSIITALVCLQNRAARADITIDGNLIDKLIPDTSLGDDPTSAVAETVARSTISRYKSLAMVAISAGTITSLFFLALSITKLGTSSDHPIMRRRAVIGLLTSCVAIILFGGLAIYIGFFWNFSRS